MKIRKRIPQENKVRAELQKEINSICPFCKNDDVGHFEIHHIDEDPSNNKINNLILICPICHSKITKGDILFKEVIIAKENLSADSFGIEFVSVVIDSDNCSWNGEDSPNVFFDSGNKKSPFPVLSFTLINHVDKTVVLKTIRVKVKNLPSGIHGIPKAKVLKSLIKYEICINANGDANIYPLSEPIQLPAHHAAKFDIELYEKIIGEEIVAPQGRKVLSFIFEFSDELKVAIPKIFFNCTNENELLKIGFQD